MPEDIEESVEKWAQTGELDKEGCRKVGGDHDQSKLNIQYLFFVSYFFIFLSDVEH